MLNRAYASAPYVLGVHCLQMLPLRAPIAHHDAHHKYSNHAKGAKNYAESFTVWDTLFGTTSKLAGVAAATAHKGE